MADPKHSKVERTLKRYLVRYNYGVGSLWAFVLAESKEQVESRFPKVIVYSEPPPWFTLEMESATHTYSIDKPGGWLPTLLKA